MVAVAVAVAVATAAAVARTVAVAVAAAGGGHHSAAFGITWNTFHPVAECRKKVTMMVF